MAFHLSRSGPHVVSEPNLRLDHESHALDFRFSVHLAHFCSRRRAMVVSRVWFICNALHRLAGGLDLRIGGGAFEKIFEPGSIKESSGLVHRSGRDLSIALSHFKCLAAGLRTSHPPHWRRAVSALRLANEFTGCDGDAGCECAAVSPLNFGNAADRLRPSRSYLAFVRSTDPGWLAAK